MPQESIMIGGSGRSISISFEVFRLIGLYVILTFVCYSCL